MGDSPWFNKVTVSAVFNMEVKGRDGFCWPDLDVDLTIDGIKHPDKYLRNEWPFSLTNFKSNIHSAVSNLSPRLNSIKGTNPVYIHPTDAEKHIFTQAIGLLLKRRALAPKR
jgi:anaerobic selenocysteine-containing dehydrogenase